MTTIETSSGRGFCAGCEYDLTGVGGGTGTGGARCPECGAALTGAAGLALRERRTLRRVLRTVAVLIAAMTSVSVVVVLALPEQAPYLVPVVFLVVAPLAPVVLAATAGRER